MAIILVIQVVATLASKKTYGRKLMENIMFVVGFVWGFLWHVLQVSIALVIAFLPVIVILILATVLVFYAVKNCKDVYRKLPPREKKITDNLIKEASSYLKKRSGLIGGTARLIDKVTK